MKTRKSTWKCAAAWMLSMVLALSSFGTVRTGAAPVVEEEALPVIFIADNSVGTGTGTSA